MLFLQQGPAETTGYMIAGYAVIFGVMLVYLVSLILRRRRVSQDLEALEEIEGVEKSWDGQWYGDKYHKLLDSNLRLCYDIHVNAAIANW